MRSIQAKCPHCRRELSRPFLRSIVGKLNNQRRIQLGKVAGHPKVRRACQFCKKRTFGARELKDHTPRCAMNPKRKLKMAEGGSAYKSKSSGSSKRKQDQAVERVIAKAQARAFEYVDAAERGTEIDYTSLRDAVSALLSGLSKHPQTQHLIDGTWGRRGTVHVIKRHGAKTIRRWISALSPEARGKA
jgi:hypothetical protein